MTTLEQLKKRSPIHRWKLASKHLRMTKKQQASTNAESGLPADTSKSPAVESEADFSNSVPQRLDIDPTRHQPRRAEASQRETSKLNRAERPRATSVTLFTPVPETADPVFETAEPRRVFQPALVVEDEFSTTEELIVDQVASSNETQVDDVEYVQNELNNTETIAPSPFDFEVAQAPQPVEQNDSYQFGDVQTDERGLMQITDPRQLKGISDINPFYDYEPSGISGSDEDCYSVCPCPDGNCRKPGSTTQKSCLCPEETWPTLAYNERNFAQMCYAWEASNLWYNPLYFQDVGLERYGHTHNEAIQPFISMGKFGGQVLMLPYQMSLNPACRKKYALGYYRPGECAPKKCYQLPLSAKAAAAQAGVMSGMILLFP